MTNTILCDIISRSSRKDDKIKVSGCGAAGSALPWGGRGRKFKSCHSDQNRRFGWTSDFLYFTGFFGILGVCTASKMCAFFCQKSAQNRGRPHVWPYLSRKKLYAIRVFDTLRFSFYAKWRRFSALRTAVFDYISLSFAGK